MEWLSYTIRTETEAEEAVTAMLAGLGIESLEIIEADPLSAEDKALLFLAPDAELQPDEAVPEGELQVRFYLHSALDPDTAVPAQEGGDTDDSYTVHDRRYSPEEIRALEEAVEAGLRELEALGCLNKAVMNEAFPAKKSGGTSGKNTRSRSKRTGSSSARPGARYRPKRRPGSKRGG